MKSVCTKSYVFTDCHLEVLKAVNFNVVLNVLNITPKKDLLISYAKNGPPPEYQPYPWTHFSPSGCKVQIDKLDWTETDHKLFDEVDWILGADIVYERSLIDPLCRVLSNLLNLNVNATALIACTERSNTTLDTFEKALLKHSMKFLVVGRGSFTPSENLLCSDVSHQHTRIYKVNIQK